MSVALLGDLAKALEAHDLAGLASRIATALAPLGPSWVEVAAGEQDLTCAAVTPPAGAMLSARPAAQALIATLRAPAVLRMPLSHALASLPEALQARKTGAAFLLFLPVLRRGGPGGQVVAGLRAPVSDDLLAAMTQIASAGVTNVGLITRLAELSRRAHRENRVLRATQPPSLRLVGAAPAFRQAVAAAEAVAVHATPVLLRGETGTGKELLAHHLHARSPRARRPFLQLNCGAIPEGLVEAELFGHERGAFTGAVRRHPGIFQRAEGGSVLLDEVAELPLASQVKLLRVLQSGEYHPVGGDLPRHADVRIIAATHRDLEAMTAAGTFRADLFFRLNVFPIVLPPLRERSADVAAIAAALLPRIASRLGRATLPALDRATLARLEAYPWPGNVRELENVLERAMILSPGPRLEIADLPAARRPHDSLAAATRRHIEAALRASGGKIYGSDGAAARLGLPPSTLQSKMRRLGVGRR